MRPPCCGRRTRRRRRGVASDGTSRRAFGDYQLVVDAIADRLLDIRETYRGTLAAEADAEYAAAFTRAATQRFRRYATLLADLEG